MKTFQDVFFSLGRGWLHLRRRRVEPALQGYLAHKKRIRSVSASRATYAVGEWNLHSSLLLSSIELSDTKVYEP